MLRWRIGIPNRDCHHWLIHHDLPSLYFLSILLKRPVLLHGPSSGTGTGMPIAIFVRNGEGLCPVTGNNARPIQPEFSQKSSSCQGL